MSGLIEVCAGLQRLFAGAGHETGDAAGLPRSWCRRILGAVLLQGQLFDGCAEPGLPQPAFLLGRGGWAIRDTAVDATEHLVYLDLFDAAKNTSATMTL